MLCHLDAEYFWDSFLANSYEKSFLSYIAYEGDVGKKVRPVATVSIHETNGPILVSRESSWDNAGVTTSLRPGGARMWIHGLENHSRGSLRDIHSGPLFRWCQIEMVGKLWFLTICSCILFRSRHCCAFLL